MEMPERRGEQVEAHLQVLPLRLDPHDPVARILELSHVVLHIVRRMSAGLARGKSLLLRFLLRLLLLLLVLLEPLVPRDRFEAEKPIEDVVDHKNRRRVLVRIQVGQGHHTDIVLRQESELGREAVDGASVRDYLVAAIGGNAEG